MSGTRVWKAIAGQAAAWRGISAVAAFAAPLPRNASDRSRGLSGLLQQLLAGGLWMESRPLVAPSTVPAFLEAMQVPVADPTALTSWLHHGTKVERAHRLTVAWLRSRLPGYPMLPAPQLGAGTPLTTNEFSWRLTWAADERSRGLHLRPAPTGVSEALDADERQAWELAERARNVAAALQRTDAWGELREAHTALTTGDRAILRACRGTIEARLSAAVLDAHEPELALPRDLYRQTAVREELARLSGAAHSYATAFDHANDLLETAASGVFGQLAVYGPPVVVRGAEEIDLLPPPRREVRFIAADDGLLAPGMLCWLEDSLIRDAVRIDTVTFSFDVATGGTQAVHATMLDGTSGAWEGDSGSQGERPR